MDTAPDGAPLRALLLAYLFPPTGGVGSERVRKLAKYLPEHGVDPTVLTALNPSVPLVDHSIERDVRPGQRILKARTVEPGYAVKKAAWAASSAAAPTFGQRLKRAVARAGGAMLVPDPQILWQPHLQRVLAGQLFRRSREFDLLYITAPPFSSFLAAPTARLRPGTAVVLDYRDEWITTRTTYEMIGGRMAAAVGGALEGGLLRCAHAVTTANEEMRQNLLGRFKFLDPARVVAITNGYDPDDFPAELPPPPEDRFVITYAGTVYKLTSARGFLQAVRLLHEREPELARHLDVRFIGRIVDTELDAFEGTEALGVKRLGFVEKERVAVEQGAGHLVLLLLADEPAAVPLFPAKTFELMYLGRPVLTLAPPGALGNIVQRHQLGTVLSPADPQAIAAYLEQALRAWKAGRYPVRSAPVDIERYHRRALAGEFAAVFRDAVARARA